MEGRSVLRNITVEASAMAADMIEREREQSRK